MQRLEQPKDPLFSRRDLRLLILPLVVEQLLGMTVGLADSLMVARVGEAAVSAVSLVDTVNILLQNAFAALATGGAVVAGQYLGRQEPGKANQSGQQLLLFMGELSLVITLVMYLAKGFILGVVFGQIQPDVAASCSTYYSIVEASTPFLAIYSAGAALFRVMGNSAISMKVSLIMNAINVAGNAIMIFGFHRGVEGVAIPTLVSRIVAAVLMVALLYNAKLTLHLEGRFSFRHQRNIIRNILYFGVPNGIESSMFQLGKILLLAVVSALGTASVAANAIGNTICNFQILPGSAIGLALVTVVSRCVGAGDYEKARYYTKKLMKYTYLFMLLSNAVVLALLPLILKVYNVSPEATRLGTAVIVFHGVASTLLWPAAFTLPQTLRSAGDTRYTMLVSSVSMWVLRVILGVALVQYWGFDLLGIWYAMVLDWVVRILFFYLRYRGHKWEVTRLRDS